MKKIEIILCATMYVAIMGLTIWAVSGKDGKENENEQNDNKL